MGCEEKKKSTRRKGKMEGEEKPPKRRKQEKIRREVENQTEINETWLKYVQQKTKKSEKNWVKEKKEVKQN